MNIIKYIIAGLTLPSMLLAAKSQIIDEYDSICHYAMMSNNTSVVEQNVRKVKSSNKRVEYYTWLFSTKNIDKDYVIGHIPNIVRNTEFNDEQWNNLTNILISKTEDTTGTKGSTLPTLRFAYLMANKGKLPTSNSQLFPDINTTVSLLLDGGLDKSIREVNIAKTEIANKLTKQIKIYLRKNNKSFVSIIGPDGKVSVNPIADCSKPSIDALNAPQCIGLEAELRKIGFEVDDFDRTRLNALIPKYMDDIMYGEIPYSSDIVGSILIYLGVDGYNAWVNEYNNGVSERSSTDNLKKKLATLVLPINVISNTLVKAKYQHKLVLNVDVVKAIPTLVNSDLTYSSEVIKPVSLASDLTYSSEVIKPVLTPASDLTYSSEVIKPAKPASIFKSNYRLRYRDMSLIAPYADVDSHFGVKLYKVYSSIISNDTDMARILLKDYITEREQVAIPDFTIYNILGIHN